jgi:hypothetical protein
MLYGGRELKLRDALLCAGQHEDGVKSIFWTGVRYASTYCAMDEENMPRAFE